jgi:hypothetical protein
MKINLAENMLRFGVKNLNETATRKIKTLAEQTPTAQGAVTQPAPTPVKPTTTPATTPGTPYSIPVSNTLFFFNGDYTAIVNVNIEYLAATNEIKVINLNINGSSTDNKIVKKVTFKPFSIKGPFQNDGSISEQIGKTLQTQLATITKEFTDTLQTFMSHVAYTKTSGAFDKTTGVPTKEYKPEDVKNAWITFSYDIGNAISGYVIDNPKKFPNLISKTAKKPVK